MSVDFLWTPEIENEICDAIAGGVSLDDVCRGPGMPSDSTVYRRMARDVTFGEKMAKARAAQQHHEADRCIRIAEQSTHETVQSDRLLIDAIKWRAGKLAPKVYGDKIATEITGADGAPLLPPTIAVTFVRPSSPGEPSGEA